MSKIKPKFFGKKINGKFVLNEREQYELYLDKFKDGTEMEMTIARKYKRRTSGQVDEETNFNGYYWAVVIRMVSDAMYEEDDDYTHDLVQIEVGNVRMSSEGKEVPAGTKNMSGGEFAEYCGKVRMWASKTLSISIPEPNEVEWQ